MCHFAHTHIAVLYPCAVLLFGDLPVRSAFEEAIGTVLLFMNRCSTLAVQQVVALPQSQKVFTTL